MMKRFTSMLTSRQLRFNNGGKPTSQRITGRPRSNKTAVKVHFFPNQPLTKTYYLPNTMTMNEARWRAAKKLETFIGTTPGLSAFKVDIDSAYIPGVPQHDSSSTIGSTAPGAPLDIYFGRSHHSQSTISSLLAEIDAIWEEYTHQRIKLTKNRIQILEDKMNQGIQLLKDETQLLKDETQLLKDETQLLKDQTQLLEDEFQLLKGELDEEIRLFVDHQDEWNRAIAGDKQAIEQIRIRFLLDSARRHVLKITGYSKWYNLRHNMSEEKLADMLEKGPEFTALSLVAPREAASMIYSSSNVYRKHGQGDKAFCGFPLESFWNIIGKVEGRDQTALTDIFTIASAEAND